MIVTPAIAEYLTRVAQAAQDPDAEVPWETTCPECGDVPRFIHDMEHLMVEVAPNSITRPGGIKAVVIACEGYMVVNPNIIGMRDRFPGWMSLDDQIDVTSRRRREVAECGTDSGYQRHIRMGTEPDADCRAAHAAIQRGKK